MDYFRLQSRVPTDKPLSANRAVAISNPTTSIDTMNRFPSPLVHQPDLTKPISASTSPSTPKPSDITHTRSGIMKVNTRFPFSSVTTQIRSLGMERVNKLRPKKAARDGPPDLRPNGSRLSNILKAARSLIPRPRPRSRKSKAAASSAPSVPSTPSLTEQPPLRKLQARGERDPVAMNSPARQMDIIDLVSDDDNSDNGDSKSDLFVRAPERPLANQQAQAANPPEPFQQDAAMEDLLAAPAPHPVAAHDVWGDYMLDEAFDDEALARAVMEGFNEPQFLPQGAASPQPRDISGAFDQVQPQQQPPQPPAMNVETRQDCLDTVVIIFPDICRDHVSSLYNEVAQNSDRIIAYILDKTEKGQPYPKAKDKQKTLKRKREVNEDEAAVLKYGAADRAAPSLGSTRTYIRNILSHEFPETPMIFIDATLNQSNYRLFQAYRVLEEAQRTFDLRNPPYNKIKKSRGPLPQFHDDKIQAFIDDISEDRDRAEVLRELQASRRIKRKADQKRAEECQAELEEKENLARAQAEGTMSECGCCFGDYPLNRMVHCDGDILHWFCRGCARQTAEAEIGNSKYELHCMSMDGCDAGFGNDQRRQFLDEKTLIALERNEQEAMLRMAGIENLASCPFCPFAAEYPPVEVNKEFQCQAPDCERVSCRLCKLESHIPKSCEENAKENGLSVRRQIEEAMSAALIRKCNKCGTPFVKEEGCNKMTYDHFDDRTRGGKEGNCPLFESVEARHDEEVKKAEKDALEKVRAEHPEYTEDDLKVKVSENVLKDEERRKANDPRARLQQLPGHRYIPPPPIVFPPVAIGAQQRLEPRRENELHLNGGHDLFRELLEAEDVIPRIPRLPRFGRPFVADPAERAAIAERVMVGLRAPQILVPGHQPIVPEPVQLPQLLERQGQENGGEPAGNLRPGHENVTENVRRLRERMKQTVRERQRLAEALVDAEDLANDLEMHRARLRDLRNRRVQPAQESHDANQQSPAKEVAQPRPAAPVLRARPNPDLEQRHAAILGGVRQRMAEAQEKARSDREVRGRDLRAQQARQMEQLEMMRERMAGMQAIVQERNHAQAPAGGQGAQFLQPFQQMREMMLQQQRAISDQQRNLLAGGGRPGAGPADAAAQAAADALGAIPPIPRYQGPRA
ncbi:hypothetical protein G7Y89_g6019 [Cudoniella acicularis]|uniref:RING-type domain-containing protein n=1 Tax=Cudoniella acicularis TaxID=354080 RepID=A0A8H4RNI6_9HELO|nr:hypothetical protein G7Y89_g6019 [Cudoniella acicularis]